MKQKALENEENPKDNKELDKVKSKTKKSILNSSNKKKSSNKLMVDEFISEYDYQPDNGI